MPKGTTAAFEFDFGKAADMLIYLRLKKVVSDALVSCGIDPDSYDLNKLLSFTQARNIAIREEYNRSRQKGIKAERLHVDLAVKYDLDYTYIKRIIYENL